MKAIMIVLLFFTCPLQAAEAKSDLEFAFMRPAKPKPLTDAEALETLRVEGSAVTFTKAERRSSFVAVDWFPDEHALAPDLITKGRAPNVSACGRCHMVTGTGKPENASLAGLDKPYIARQLQDMRSGKRVHPNAHMEPSAMFAIARELTDAEIELASDWYSRQTYQPVLSVEEAAVVPAVSSIGWLWALNNDGQRLSTAGKIIEVARNGDAFEKADLRDGIVAYVPVGAIARGRQLAEQGREDVPACQSCHGIGLTGAIGPALAARYPNYIIRQLFGFAQGRRTGAYATQMASFAQNLTPDDMIAVAAFAASLKP